MGEGSLVCEGRWEVGERWEVGVGKLYGGRNVRVWFVWCGRGG